MCVTLRGIRLYYLHRFSQSKAALNRSQSPTGGNNAGGSIAAFINNAININNNTLQSSVNDATSQNQQQQQQIQNDQSNSHSNSTKLESSLILSSTIHSSNVNEFNGGDDQFGQSNTDSSYMIEMNHLGLKSATDAGNITPRPAFLANAVPSTLPSGKSLVSGGTAGLLTSSSSGGGTSAVMRGSGSLSGSMGSENAWKKMTRGKF
ncbi:hypothetical protein HDU76_004409, partial [Blyttiomyces sp. JEL0837]